MQYKYEMHQHTAGCSRCGRADMYLLIKTLKEQGFAGCVLTEHFYHGNSGIDRNLSWNEFCKPYIDSYFNAKKIAEEFDFDILFGLEEGVGEGKEVLLYGVTPEFLTENPELRNADLKLLYETAKKYNIVVIQAHPFREKYNIPNPDELLDCNYLDGFEIWNSVNTHEQNDKAITHCEKLKKIPTAGSDAHKEDVAERSYIISDEKIKTEEKLSEILTQRKFKIFRGN